MQLLGSTFQTNPLGIARDRPHNVAHDHDYVDMNLNPTDHDEKVDSSSAGMGRGKTLNDTNNPAPAPAGKASEDPEQGEKPVPQGTRKRTWKKPKDKPKRPLSSYNIYFQHERQRLVDGKTGEASPEAVIASVEAILSKSKTKRRHRKSHGKISFGDLARAIAESWKTVSPKTKSIFEHYAERDMLRYKRELKVWRDKKDREQEATTLARHSQFINSMGSSFSGSLGSEASYSSTSDYLDGLPEEGARGGPSVASSSSSFHQQGRPETASFNSSISSLDSQPAHLGGSRTRPMAETPFPSAPLSMADHVIQRQRQILHQQLLLDSSNNTTSSGSMNISMSSHSNHDRAAGGLMAQSSMFGSSSTHSMPNVPAGVAMGGMGPSGVNTFGSISASMHSATPGTVIGSSSGAFQNTMQPWHHPHNTMMMNQSTTSQMRGEMMMPRGAARVGGSGMIGDFPLATMASFQQPQQHMGSINVSTPETSLQQHFRQQQQQQLQRRNMAMLHGSSSSLQLGDAFVSAEGAPNIVSDHTRTSIGQQSGHFNNSQSTFSAFGNSTSSFVGMPMVQGQGSTGNFSVLQSVQPMQQQQGGGGGGLTSASYHSGMRQPMQPPQQNPGGMTSLSHHHFGSQTIDEHGYEYQEHGDSFAFPQGEGFQDPMDRSQQGGE